MARRESERERERLVAEIVGRGYIAEQKKKKKREHATRSTVASVLMLFAKERRNDMSAEAIAKFLSIRRTTTRPTRLRKHSINSAPPGITTLSSTRQPLRERSRQPAR